MVSQQGGEVDSVPTQQKSMSERVRMLDARFVFLSISVILAAGTYCWYRVHGMHKTKQGVPTGRSNENILEVQLLENRPEADHRQYQYSKFTNGLEVVNVLDKTAKTNSFAVAVEAGQFLDPKGVLGLAHFCEHMLFLGTHKYPNPSGFDKYLNLHGGENNAYTAEEATVYYAELEHSGWKEGMDRLADFFRAPLFNRKFVNKEVHAIESEHAKNKRNPGSRTIEILNSLADPRSPLSRFHTGDISTLIDEPKKKGIDTVAELKKYFKHNYCPPRMRLVTFGKDTLDAQLSEALTHFADIPKGDSCSSAPPKFDKPDPWHPADGPSRMGHWVDTRSTQPQAELWVMWAMPSQQSYYKQHPLMYLEHVMNYGGEGSFVRTIQDHLGLATQLDFSGDSNSATTTIIFVARLTHKGREHPTLLLSCLYAFLAKVKDHGIDMELFTSLSKIEKLKWNWAEEPDPVSTVQNLVEQMTRLPHEDLLTGDYLTPEPDAEKTRMVLNALTPDNMNVMFVDPKWDPKKHGDKVKTLPHYDAEYEVRDLDDVLPDHMKAWSHWIDGSRTPEAVFKELSEILTPVGLAPVKTMRHAEAIRDIPEQITLDHAQAELGNDVDTKLFGIRPMEFGKGKTNHQGSFWFRQGSTSKDPKVDMKFMLRTAKPKDDPSPNDDLLVGLYARLLAEQLDPKALDIEMTGCGFSVSPDVGPNAASLSFSFSGFYQNIPKLMELVFKEFKSPIDTKNSVVQARYKRFVEELRDDLQTYSAMPTSYAIADRNRILQKGNRANEEYLAVLDNLKLEDVHGALKTNILEKKMHYTSMIMGNIPLSEAQANDKLFLTEMKGVDTNLPFKDIELVTPIVNPQVPIEIRKKNPRNEDPNHVTVVSLLQGIPDVADRVLNHINGEILGNLAFDELRTKRQLGYVVNAGAVQLSNVMGVSAVVQGTKMMPDDVESLIEWLYHVKMRETLSNMTDQQFEQHKLSFAEGLTEPPLGFSDEIGYFWGPVLNGGQCFHLRVDMLHFVQNKLTSKQQLIKAWDRMLAPQSSGVRKKVVVKYFAEKVPTRPSVEDTMKKLRDAGLSRDFLEFASQEYDSAILFDKVDSSTRNEILTDAESRVGKGKGYFPDDLGCDKAASTAPEAAALLDQAEQTIHDSILNHASSQRTLMKHARASSH